LPDPTPSIFRPSIDVATNKNFLGVPIESEGEKYQYPTKRVRTYNSFLSKKLSIAFDEVGIKISPIQLDYLLNAHTGGVFRQIPYPGMKVLEPADIPVLGDVLLRMPDNPRQQLNEMFNDYEVLTQKNKSGILEDNEVEKYEIAKRAYSKINPLFKELRIYKERKNIEKIRNIYKEMGRILNAYGYK